ncbi:unnamed protein product [Caenorhabditis auriculariae]|uniref:tRNA-dihydrouridine synthase n=1 Tax=Caenorhabditis auriculariae TaxID=2777116 RepID=A0A8S1GRZ4_9PELO|nr:unnamed protein product [Caenorhabditis auriculariae]
MRLNDCDGERPSPTSRPKFYLAPMVRYSKLAFRQLVRLYDVDVCYTPMIYAKNFLESAKCRSSEFSTCDGSQLVFCYFATDDPFVLAAAAEMVSVCASGVDLNCGCPKHDVRSKGFGSALLSKPELLADMVRQTRQRVPNPDFSVSLKIRINYPIERTVDLCRQAEHAERNRSIEKLLRIINDAVNVPIIANGGITTRQEAIDLAKETGVSGIMAANGLLTNPALFSGHETTPQDCVENFMRLSLEHGLDWLLYHQHLQYMLRPVMTPSQRRVFNELNGRLAVDHFIRTTLLPPDDVNSYFEQLVSVF